MKRDAKYGMVGGGCEAAGACRTDLLFAAGTAAVIGGLFFPAGPHILDVLLVFGTSLTAAVLLIAFSAQGALQVQSFPLLVVIVTTLRMALCVACAKLILLHGNAGTIASCLGHVIVGGNLAFTIVLFGVFAAGIFVIVCKVVKDIRRRSAEFICDIIPARHISIAGGLGAGVISESEAYRRQVEAGREAGFFLAMSGIAKFMLCDAVIEFVIIVVNVTASSAVGAAPELTGMSAGGSGVLAVGAGFVTQMSVLTTALACGYLVRRSFAGPALGYDVLESSPCSEVRVEAAASEAAAPATKKAWCDGRMPATSETEVVDLEFIEEDAVGLWACDEITDRSGYEAMAELIERKSCGAAKAILMAAARVEALPVTIPVNVGMLLAKKGLRCVLVDVDSERDAVAKVFDIDCDVRNGDTSPEDGKGYLGVPTCVENLWVLPAGTLYADRGQTGRMGRKDLIERLKSEYDRLLIYAPNAGSSARWEELAGCVDIAMLFGDCGQADMAESVHICGFQKLLADCGCEILEPSEVYAEAV